MHHGHQPPFFQSGFTLLEAVVTLGITALVFIIIGQFSTNIFKTSSALSTTLIFTDQARATMEELVSELRTASISSLGAYPIQTADGSHLTFYSNIDHDTLKERLRYFVQGTTLERGVIKPSGSPLTYNPANETVTVAIKYLTNPTNVFSYYDSSYNGQSAPLTNPPTITAIRLVGITFQTDNNPNLAPGLYQLSSQVNLRNLKDNL